MEQGNIIEISNLTKQFRAYKDKANTLKEKVIRLGSGKKEIYTVLDNINLNIKKGEVVGLIGTNGSGKSTLLKLITKILYPTKGKISVNGNMSSLLELGAGFHQDFNGIENIYFNASIFGLSKKQIDERLDRIVEFSELGEFLYQPVRTYSSGMYMRLAFSVAINVDADVILIDEILAVGDEYFQNKCRQKLLNLKENGITMVIVSHDLASLRNICDRVVWIKDGNINMEGNKDEVIDKYIEYVKGDSNE